MERVCWVALLIVKVVGDSSKLAGKVAGSNFFSVRPRKWKLLEDALALHANVRVRAGVCGIRIHLKSLPVF